MLLLLFLILLIGIARIAHTYVDQRFDISRDLERFNKACKRNEEVARRLQQKEG